MPEIHPPTRAPHFRGAAIVSVLLSLGLLGACGSSDGNRDRGPAISSGTGDEGGAAAEPATRSDASIQERLPPPGQAWVIFGVDTVEVEVARTPEERERGLMYRQELQPGHGMLFLFQDAQHRSFWMRNTFIPLDIAYMDENLRIVDIQAMEPETEDGHPSAQPAMFALEVPQGWFSAQGIGVGNQAELIFGPGS